MRKGYWSEEVDGKFTTYLRSQVVLFQRAKGLSADGIAGPATITALFK